MNQNGSVYALVVLIVVLMFAGFVYVLKAPELFPQKTTQPALVYSPSPFSTPVISSSPSASVSTQVSSPSPKVSPKTLSSSVQSSKNLQVTLSGRVYRDVNCNEVMEDGEQGLANLDIRIDQQPNYNTVATVKSNANGNFSYTKNLNENDYISLGPDLVAPDGYKIHGNYLYSDLSKNFPNVTINLPLVPIESINQGLCPIPN